MTTATSEAAAFRARIQHQRRAARLAMARALRLTGIKSRSTLIAERDRPGTPLKYSKHGRSASYSLVSCLHYKQGTRLAA